MASETILSMRNITKLFPGVKALDGVNFDVNRGEIHAICGENGAGKSTLIKVLCGVYPAGSFDGDINIENQSRQFSSTADAEKSGIVCIHQELELIPELSVGENIALGNYSTRGGLIQWNRIYSEAQELLSQVGLGGGKDKVGHEIDPHEKIYNLGIGQQQLVEIAKALSRNARILILDEPTAALTEKEVDILLEIIDGLRQKGITCIYISHRLEEVIRVADTVTVLRDGKTIGSRKVEEIGKDDIVSMMVGRELTNLFPRVKHSQGQLVLEVKNFSVQDPNVHGRTLIRNVNIKAYKGEILGIAGLMGAGRTELFSSIFGAFQAANTGTIYLNGTPIKISNTVDALKHGIFLVTEDRKRYGLVLGMDVKENTTLASLSKVSNLGYVSQNKEVHETIKYVTDLQTKTTSVEVPVRNLSGGNQQKVVLQKALMTKPAVLILDEPTRGIDVGAKYEIYKIMNELVERGVVVIMISSEMEEVLGMSDRIVVMSQGEVTDEFTHQDATQDKIMHACIGGSHA